MATYSFMAAYKACKELKRFNENALLLFALSLRFNIEDIITVGTNSLPGDDDKKADLIYIDTDLQCAVIAQAFINKSKKRKTAKANKASDLNTAASWLLSRDLSDLPVSLRSHAEELRRVIQDGEIRTIYFWYVHNLPESKNVAQELKTVEHTAHAVLRKVFPQRQGLIIQSMEIGLNTIEGWYISSSVPILISDKLRVPIIGGYSIKNADWSAFVTAIPVNWLYEQFRKYKTKLFSADIRDYLGTRNTDININKAIRETCGNDPKHFWVFNNGITALVHRFRPKGSKELVIQGFSIVNGAQTTGALSSLPKIPSNNAMVQVRFITCGNKKTIHDIVKYNNSQNKVEAPDYRSGDATQTRLIEEFRKLSTLEYSARRGGAEDLIKRKSNFLPSVTAGQALAALHKDPTVAYHQKTQLWINDALYSAYFNEHTSAKHIFFAYSLLRAVQTKKMNLLDKNKINKLTQAEKEYLSFFRLRGSIFLFVAAISNSLETVLNKQIPNFFVLVFNKNLTLEQAIIQWEKIIEVVCPFCNTLIVGFSNGGLKDKGKINAGLSDFRRYVEATRNTNKSIFLDFAKLVKN